MKRRTLYTRLMNRKEWKELRERKLKENPYCEFCEKEGAKIKATCIHHIKEVESGNTEEESIALCYDFENLVSLCEYHHHKLHNEKGYHTREAIMRRREAAFNRTINKLFKK